MTSDTNDAMALSALMNATEDVPVFMQRHVLVIQTAQKTGVGIQRQAQMTRKAEKTAEILQAQLTDEVIEVPVAMQQQVLAVQVM